jgi:hypothetical protein
MTRSRRSERKAERRRKIEQQLAALLDKESDMEHNGADEQLEEAILAMVTKETPVVLPPEPFNDWRLRNTPLFKFCNDESITVSDFDEQMLARGVQIRPRDIFYELTRHTSPHGTEWRVHHDFIEFMEMIGNIDKEGNCWMEIPHPDGTRSDTVFAAHIDTADTSIVINGERPFPPAIVHKWSGMASEEVVGTNGKTILGADDKAGVTVMAWLAARRVPGRYVLFMGEERGRVGSEAMAKELLAEPDNHFLTGANRMICFDRYGYDSIITSQMGIACCSDEFAAALALEINQHIRGVTYKGDDTGLYTDSASFIGSSIAELTNLSIGYYGQHTEKETQDVSFLDLMCHTFAKVDWDSLPTVRDPKSRKYTDNWSGYGYYTRGDWREWNEQYAGDDDYEKWGYVKDDNGVWVPKEGGKSKLPDNLDPRYRAYYLTERTRPTLPEAACYHDLVRRVNVGYANYGALADVFKSWEAWHLKQPYRAQMFFHFLLNETIEKIDADTVTTFEIVRHAIQHGIDWDMDDNEWNTQWKWINPFNYVRVLFERMFHNAPPIDWYQLGEWTIVTTVESDDDEAVGLASMVTNGRYVFTYDESMPPKDGVPVKAQWLMSNQYTTEWLAEDIDLAPLSDQAFAACERERKEVGLLVDSRHRWIIKSWVNKNGVG